MRGRKAWFLLSVLFLVFILLLALFAARPAIPASSAATVDPQILVEMAASADGRASFFVLFREQADLTPAYAIADRPARGSYVYAALQETAARSQARVRAWLDAQGIAHRTFISDNSLFLTADLAVADRLAAFPEVAALRASSVRTLEELPAAAEVGPAAVIPWSIIKIRADQVWQDFGVKGQGVVVATIDTGAEYTHSALFPNYRCGAGPHADCWNDPTSSCGGGVPCDDNGHGTFLMGILAGDDNPALAYNAGVAPAAQWIACKGCLAGGSCPDPALNACADWLLAPNGNPANRPDVIVLALNSSQKCDGWFLPQIMAWQAAGIYPVVRPGSNGPACDSMRAPGSYEGLLTAGATDESDTIAYFSSRGPGCGGGIKPDVVAPGVNLCSTYPGNSWACGYSGTSWSTAHAAGLAALLFSADPGLVGDAISTTYAITSTALCIENLSCGGTPCPDGGNNVYGWGRIDAYAAVERVLHPCEPVALADFAWAPSTPTAGQLITLTGWVGTGWLTETVDDAGQGGLPSLALDSAGRPHVSYQDGPPAYRLHYAYFDGSSWVTTTVDPGMNLFSSLALDGNDYPRVAHGIDDGEFSYLDGSGWHTELFSDYPANCQSLALDGAGRPHVSYYGLGSGGQTLNYAYSDGSTWLTQTVQSGSGCWTSIALDPAGRPRIKYVSSAGDLRYAWYSSTVWYSETVASGLGGTGGSGALVLDKGGLPHLSYHNAVDQTADYAYFDGSAWVSETVDSSHASEGYTSLALDSLDRPHLVYFDALDGGGCLLRYAHWTGSSWQTETVDRFDDQGYGLSLQLDEYSRPHIAYQTTTDNPAGTLRYARLLAPSPPITLTWDLGDGEVAEGLTISHTYAQPGEYRVTLTATNCADATATAVHTVTVQCAAARDASFSWAPSTPAAGQTVTFTGTATGTLPISYSWKLDVGSGREGAVVTYSYSLPDTYAVVLTATNCVTAAATVSHTITVLPALCSPGKAFGFTWQPLVPVAGEATSFYGYSDGDPPITYTWDLGDGTFAGGQAVSHTYASAGRYTVALTVTNCGTLTQRLTQTVRVLAPLCDPLTATGLTLQPPTPTAGLPVTFTAWSNGPGWFTSTADAGGVGPFTALALDAAGWPHLAYYHAGQGDLRYAALDAGGWHTATVDSAGDVGQFVSLAVDPYGNLHASYYDAGNGDLKYAYHAGDGGWYAATVDSASSVGRCSSLALDGAVPHISYYDEANGALKYAFYSKGTGNCGPDNDWSCQTLDSAVGGGCDTSLAIDAEGHPHIVYFVSTYELRYAYFDGAAWHIATAIAGGEKPSLRLDAAGRPVVSFFDSYAGMLKYARFDGATWQAETVDPLGWPPAASSLRLDAAGRPHIGYDNAGAGDLRYAYRDGSTWYTATVDSAGDVGASPSVDVDGAGRVHIGYYDAGGNLRYARLAGPPSPPLTFTWSFGDGGGAAGPIVSHTYATGGAYTVSLEAANPCGRAAASQLLAVVPSHWDVYLPIVFR